MKMIKELARGTAEPLVLRVLAEGPQHGYGILQAIRERSGEVLEFTEGTIYPLLHTLEEEGLVTAAWEVLASGRRRKSYALTPAGEKRLAEARQQWERFRGAMDALFGPGKVVRDGI